ncbi:ribose transport system permease protein [Microbacterium trichothecenolyticum]|uniref:ABC transporter permease n=1 Tax=Microbacterium trichothecenolyticum TaxID=69370 RepID=UPI002856AC5F|nr:ABC transporter permease [Microbacterium trichothecenolyticum]MDR7183267.1 ribose transport system permease protein [Microbacterium trichothecenolyticum]
MTRTDPSPSAPVTTTTSLPVPATARSAESLWRRTLAGSWVPITVATVALFLVSPLIAPGSLGAAPLLSMLPFASVLAIAAAGQTLVVQQRGLDLSVPGMIALAAVLATALPQQYGWGVWPAVAVAVTVPGLFGLLNGLVIAGLRIMPLVATLGMNAVLLGTVFSIANGTPSGAADELNRFALARTAGIPNSLLIAIVVIAIAAVVTQRSVIGRRLTAVGVSEAAASVIGVRVGLYQVAAYGFAGLCYGAAGVLLAGYTKTPPLFLGDQYLLPTVAAVVLGGTALTGGISSIAATAVAALFLTQLGQLLRSVGWPDALQLIAQAVVLIAVVLLRELVPALLRRRAVRRLVAA